MEPILDVDNKYLEKLKIKKIEIEYGDMNYIIINLNEQVIDVDGQIYEVIINEKELSTINEYIWEYNNIDEFDYWPDKTKDHAPISPLWRLSWIDELDVYHHKSGATKYPDKFNLCVNFLLNLKHK